MCKSCTNIQTLKLSYCYDCRLKIKCYYCENFCPITIDFLQNYSCYQCVNTKKCANCFNIMENIYTHPKQKDYCTKCELKRGKCSKCKSSKILMSCGLCRQCETDENMALCQKNVKIDVIVLEKKKNCETCMKDKVFNCYLNKQ